MGEFAFDPDVRLYARLDGPDAVIVDAGGRELRVSSADRVIFPMTVRSGAVTMLAGVRPSTLLRRKPVNG